MSTHYLLNHLRFGLSTRPEDAAIVRFVPCKHLFIIYMYIYEWHVLPAMPWMHMHQFSEQCTTVLQSVRSVTSKQDQISAQASKPLLTGFCSTAEGAST